MYGSGDLDKINRFQLNRDGLLEIRFCLKTKTNDWDLPTEEEINLYDRYYKLGDYDHDVPAKYEVEPEIDRYERRSGFLKSREGSAIALSEVISGTWSNPILTKFPSYIGHFRVCALLAVIKINDALSINFNCANLFLLSTSIGAMIASFS